MKLNLKKNIEGNLSNVCLHFCTFIASYIYTRFANCTLSDKRIGNNSEPNPWLLAHDEICRCNLAFLPRCCVFFCSFFFFSSSLIFGFQFLFVSICLLCFIIILIIWDEYFAKISLRHRDVMPSKKFSPLTKLTNSGNEGRQMCTLPWCLRDSLSSRLSHFIFTQSSKRLYKNHSN